MPPGAAESPEYGLPIATARLLLRLPEQLDIDNLAALFADTRVTRWLAVGAMNLAEAREFATEFVTDCQRDMVDAGCAPLIVSRREHGKRDVAGYCGLRALPGEERKLELVYAVIPDVWRSGIVGEAARACVAWGFAKPSLRHVVALTRAGNSASLAVMAGLGMSYAGETKKYYGERLVRFEVSRGKFEAG
jgi:RimJ/RimL family protein N-acetyltransferase